MSVSWRIGCLALSLVMAGPKLLQGQCGPMHYFCGGDYSGHTVIGPAPSGVYPLHGECLFCVNGPCHFGCDESLRSDPDARRVYAQAVEAASHGDATATLRLAPWSGGYVRLNEIRSAVQVMSCSGDLVIASLPLDGPAMAAASAEEVRGPARQH